MDYSLKMEYKVEVKREPAEEMEMVDQQIKQEETFDYDGNMDYWMDHEIKVEKQETKPVIEENSKLKCKFCKKTFSHAGNFRRHEKQFHSKDTKFPCDQCSKIFYRIDYLKRHKVNHNSKTKYCECGIKIKMDNKKHKLLNCKWRNTKSKMVAEFYCEVCLKTFKTKKGLRRHESWRFKFHKFFCDHCNQGFSKKMGLEKHIRSHMGLLDRPYNCEICDKKFTTQTILANHLISHTDAKPYSCTRCNKEFKSKWGWKCHELYQKCI